MARALVVDDDTDVSDIVTAYLQDAGYEVSRAATGPAAIVASDRDNPDIVILDLMLPGLDGLAVCTRLRQRRRDLPIIMVTARGTELDRIAGFEAGADDYVTKPFSPRELVLRVESVLRRQQPPGSGPRASAGTGDDVRDVIVDGDLTLDSRARTAERDGRPLALTGREFDLLWFFASHAGEAFRRDQLLHRVWGWSFGDESTVTVHVRRVREKVERDPGNPQRLVTVWGVGYRWEAS